MHLIKEILDRNGIKSIGSNYNAKPREVVMIPQKRFLEAGLALSEDKQTLGIQAEYLLRILDS